VVACSDEYVDNPPIIIDNFFSLFIFALVDKLFSVYFKCFIINCKLNP
jgi:hypothetical protein